MLPSIVSIAEEYNLVANERTLGKKESMFKCPFCREDEDKPKKYYLSLNTDDNVYKCWYCRESGGALQFEAKLSGKSFREIRTKYFGEQKKELHLAYKLSPSQLKEIGWQARKRKDFDAFKKSKDEVLKDWKRYEYEEKVKHYALYLLVNHFPIEKERSELFRWFNEVTQESEVDSLSKIINRQINAKKEEHWAVKGKEIASLAFEIAYETGDFDFQNLFANTLLIIQMKKMVSITDANRKDKTPVSV